MIVKFRTDELAKAYDDFKFARRTWNEKIAKLYVQRVNVLHNAPNALTLSQGQSFAFKAKKHAMKGLFTMKLDGFWRLTLSFEDSAMTIAVIEEVSKHYGD